ncbi:YsnF/AvaK domain-containing protein [Candidatus Nitrosocosmicus arcticus]|uniref:Putative stress response protein YsnF n=1 Tax=Candidatus Nitrosocosmicus arcticus TaxID=2035267 RepID=A0A557SRX4_9ARCH|nr:YsnF/AvaK domain-containing protein [Candidatus Nitrosocosmicus arcticus]TVP39351.1 putative stress response protein YsnF [Candidatus Nitrosocosmicus arcticus]
MSSNIDWNDVVKKEARGLNDEDFGEVQGVSNGYVFVQKGIINKERFFIPQDKVESYDGDVLRFSISHDEALSKYQGDSYPTSPSSQAKSDQLSNTLESEETTIPLTEEKLDVAKRVEESQTTITKEPVTETKTLEVPVVHEEVSIERRTPTGHQTYTDQKPITSEEDIEIPLKSEEVEVSKTPYVKEEVVVKKKPVTETREVTEEVTSEKVNVSDSNV